MTPASVVYVFVNHWASWVCWTNLSIHM